MKALLLAFLLTGCSTSFTIAEPVKTCATTARYTNDTKTEYVEADKPIDLSTLTNTLLKVSRNAIIVTPNVCFNIAGKNPHMILRPSTNLMVIDDGKLILNITTNQPSPL